MTQPFTYRIQFIPTGEYYYGVRFKKNCSPSDLWTKYFTSSDTVHKLIREHGKSAFRFEIRKLFDTTEKAILWETRVNRYTKLWPNYLNKVDVKAIGNQFGRKGGLIGGQTSLKNKKGIHAPENQKMRPIWGLKNGNKLVELQGGVHDPEKPWLNDPVKAKNVKNGNIKGGNKTGSMPWWNNGLVDTKSIGRPEGENWVRGCLERGKYWNNGIEQRVMEECPGDGWIPGGLGTTTTGMSWWNDGQESKLFFTPPNDEWRKGKLSGKSNWWTNEIEQKRQIESPGPDWRRGQLKRK